MREMKLTSILGQAVLLQINHGKLILSDCTWWHMMTSLWHAMTLVTAIKSSQLSKVIHGRLATGHKRPIAANGFIWDYNWIIFFWLWLFLAACIPKNSSLIHFFQLSKMILDHPKNLIDLINGFLYHCRHYPENFIEICLWLLSSVGNR